MKLPGGVVGGQDKDEVQRRHEITSYGFIKIEMSSL